MSLTSEQRGEAVAKRDAISAALSSHPSERPAKVALVADYLVANGESGGEAAGASKARAYVDDALDDIPAWALRDAIRRWNRGETGHLDILGGVPNFNFAARAPVLRAACLKEIEAHRRTLRDLNALLDAKPLAELMDAAPRERPSLDFDGLKGGLGNALDRAEAVKSEARAMRALEREAVAQAASSLARDGAEIDHRNAMQEPVD